MGQYFMPVNLDRRQWVDVPADCGLKLAEQAWLGNGLMDAMGPLLGPGGPWEGQRVAWAGDYSSPLYEAVGAEEGWLRISLKEPGHRYRYALDHDRREFAAVGEREHPLPYLLASGSGSWEGDRVALADEVPEGYTETCPLG